MVRYSAKGRPFAVLLRGRRFCSFSVSLLFAPIQLFFETETPLDFVNGVPWPRELARSLECCADEQPGSVTLHAALLDAIALRAAPEAAWLAAAPLRWTSADLTWDLSLVLPVATRGVLRPTSNEARQFWVVSTRAWLADWCDQQGFSACVRVGWPVPAPNALVQLLKQDVMDVLKRVPAPIKLYWEPGAVLLESAAGLCPIATRGLPRDTALYAAQQCLTRVSDAWAASTAATGTTNPLPASVATLSDNPG